MNKGKRSGSRELSHTADWALEVWAPDLVSFLVEAAKGMFALMGVEVQPVPLEIRIVRLDAPDSEGKLVLFLNELLFLLEKDSLAFYDISIRIVNNTVNAQLVGGPILSQSKEIKAVTYHNLHIYEENGQLRGTIVFDV